MSDPIRILAIPGSLRRGSHSRSLIDVAIAVAPDAVAIEVYDDLASIPAFNEDDEGDRAPASVLAFRARIGAADAILISTPEYNGSVPGALKNAIDWASRPYGIAEIVGKPVALISSSTSPFGGTWAQQDLHKVIERAGGAPVQDGIAVGKVQERGSSEEVADEIRALLAELVKTRATVQIG
jgi:NAD(P)H-dependent FMN reductase